MLKNQMIFQAVQRRNKIFKMFLFVACFQLKTKTCSSQNHSFSIIYSGSTKDLIETCCAAGQQWAIDNGECMEIPISGTDGDICRYVSQRAA